MFLRSALGAALLAVPLTGLAGQSASEQHPPPTSSRDSSSSHRFAWLAAAGLTSATVFTTFVRMSDRSAAADAERGLTLPNSPTPNHYTDGTLPGSGVSPGQNTPPATFPPTNSSKGSGTVAGDQTPTGIGAPGTNDQPAPPPDSTTVGDNGAPPQGNPPKGNPPQYQTPPTPPMSLSLVVTTPEPDSFALLGTGLIALIPAVRLRRRTFGAR